MSRLAARIVVERSRARGAAFRLEAELSARDGITVVCGASGSGKSTLLLALVGAIRPLAGRIELDGIAIFDSERGTDLPTRRRRIGMAFQDAPLFPHLDVRGNVAFGLRGNDRERRARSLLERVGAGALASRRSAELSGGERQRVALARALAAEPAALLLDEPFSALDGAARSVLGDLLIELQASAGIPFVHVTHDLGEALRVGTRLVLLDGGRVVQSGAPAEVLARPASLAAARAVGTENLLAGRLRGSDAASGCSEIEVGDTLVQTGFFDEPPGATVVLGVRAEEILLALRPVGETSARNVLAGEIESLADRGHAVEVVVRTPTPFRVLVTPVSVRELALEPGKRVWLLIKASAFHRLA